MPITIKNSKHQGKLTSNPSKSVMQRVVAACYLANGNSEIRNPGNSNDCLAALDIIKKLGANIESIDSVILINSASSEINDYTMNCGESGLGIRMFTPIFSLNSEKITITGHGSLAKRPMLFFEDVLPKLGVKCSSNQGHIPIEIQGPLKGESIKVDGSLTSQFLTGLLMALPLAKEDSVLTVKNLKSKGYISITIEVLKTFGIEIENNHFSTFKIKGNQNYIPQNVTIEGDWSGAAFHLVGAAISGTTTIRGLNSNSKQPDLGILKALEKAGANISIDEDVTVAKNQLNAFNFDATDCPDLFPPLAALAANCKGTSVIKGTSRLTHKESNRALTIQEQLSNVGIKVILENDEMHVYGGEIKGGFIDSCNDHRIAMMAAILGLNATAPITIKNPEAINKSYPAFFSDFNSIGGQSSAC